MLMLSFRHSMEFVSITVVNHINKIIFYCLDEVYIYIFIFFSYFAYKIVMERVSSFLLRAIQVISFLLYLLCCDTFFLFFISIKVVISWIWASQAAFFLTSFYFIFIFRRNENIALTRMQKLWYSSSFFFWCCLKVTLDLCIFEIKLSKPFIYIGYNHVHPSHIVFIYLGTFSMII